MLGDFLNIVLVKPQQSLNVGSVARAMGNLGFQKLHLVNPEHYDPKKAHVTACWATSIVDEAIIHRDLDSALSSMESVVGFSVRGGKYRAKHVDLRDWVNEFLSSKPRRTAFLFGPEDHGLVQEETERCSVLVRIPSEESCPAYNLSQAVLIALYELKRTTFENFSKVDEQYPSWAEYEALDRILFDVARRTQFFHEGTPPDLPGLMRTLLKRMEPNKRELAILLGFLSRIQKSLSHNAGTDQESNSL